PVAGARGFGARGQPARRLAARRAQSEAPLMPKTLLEVEDLTVAFPTRRGELTAVDGLSFTIGEGEVLGVVGESSAGKSLPGSAHLGLIEPPGRNALGEDRFDGRRVGNLPPRGDSR